MIFSSNDNIFNMLSLPSAVISLSSNCSVNCTDWPVNEWKSLTVHSVTVTQSILADYFLGKPPGARSLTLRLTSASVDRIACEKGAARFDRLL